MSKLSFAYNQLALQQKANEVLDLAKHSGATDAYLEINEAIVSAIDVLKGNIDNFESSYDSSLSLTLYVGKQKGSVAISSLDNDKIIQAIAKAIDICKYTKADPFSGIADKEFLATKLEHELDLYHPIDLSNEQIISYATDLEDTFKQQNNSKEIVSSDGAAFSYAQYNFIVANTNGFNLGYQTTRYSSSLSLIANTPNNMQQDYWFSSARNLNDLLNKQQLVSTAINRINRRLQTTSVTAGGYSVIFEATIANSLISNFLAGISGNNLYRGLSFLKDSLSKSVFPNWLNITEDPFIVRGLASCYFDNEGVRVASRKIVENGIVRGYLLNSYTSRKLGLNTTGNAGGYHNIIVSSNMDGGFKELCHKLVDGLVIIETIGSGVNMVTGDYSVGASALVVKNGDIQGFVNGLTISGNLRDIFQNITYIANDTIQGSISCGSILVNHINVAT